MASSLCSQRNIFSAHFFKFCSSGSTPTVMSSPHRTQPSSSSTCFFTASEVSAFRSLVESRHMQEFMERDHCFMIVDCYLLAMAWVYMRRANYTPKQYTPFNLMLALYLAHESEEDDMDLKHELVRVAMGPKVCDTSLRFFLKKREKLWHDLDFRVMVSREICEQVMSNHLSNHYIWRRIRSESHSGVAVPFHVKETLYNAFAFRMQSNHSNHIRCLVCEGLRYLIEKRRNQKNRRERVYPPVHVLRQPDACSKLSSCRQYHGLKKPRILEE